MSSGSSVTQVLRRRGLPVLATLGGGHVGRDLGAMRDLPADGLEPGEGGGFNGGFCKLGHGLSAILSLLTASIA